MAISVAQHRSIDGGSATSVNLNFTGNTTSGNFIWVGVRVGATGRTITVTDSFTNSYANAVGQDQTNAGHHGEIDYAKNISGGVNDVVTVAISGAAATIRFSIEEVSGLDTVNPLDQKTSNQGSSTTPDSGSITTTNANEIVCGFGTGNNESAFSWTAGGSYSLEESIAGKIGAEDQIVSSTVTQSASFTTGATTQWTCCVASFQAPGDTLMAQSVF